MSKGPQLTASSLHANIQVGIYMAFGWTAEEIAAQIGVSPGAISNRKQNTRHRSFIDTVKEYTDLAVARLTSERIRKAEEDFTDRKRRLHSKGYKAIEKKLDEVVAEGSKESPDAVHLRAAEMAIERSEGRPLDRKAILTRNENYDRAQVDEEDLKDILGEAEQISQLRKSSLLLTAGALEAEIVQSSR